ncbi:MAG: hypothetical protein B7Y41_09110 [Hydrogenophilales bacterium 28-61-23]|nr:MAG: hypothetical protein B7Y41_09110 [Hydrogenophilales bacterium 28-61-23]
MSAPELSMHYARLFDDAHFVPYFGKPYSEMEISELEDIGRNTIMRCKKASPEFKQASASMDVLLKSFLATRQATSDRTPATQASLKLKTGIIRNARAELNLLRDEVERMQPGIAAYERIVDIQKRIPALLDPIWPSEHTGLISHFENKRISFVGPALTDLVDQAVARGSDWNGLEALRQLPEQKKQLFEQAGSGHAKAQMDKIRNQQAITLSNLMLEEAIAAKNFPVSLVGLEKGSLWYQSFHEKYLKHAEYNQHPSVTKVDKIFWEKRNATINASDAELSALVAAAKTTKDARNVVDEYLWLYQDEQNPVAQKIKKNASAAVDRILISSTQADKQKLDRMPGNLDGLHASAFWHETFQAQYGSDREHPLVKALEKHFIERRNAIVAASKSAVTKEISTAQSSYDIDEIWRKYLKSPYDQTSLIISDLKEISINRLERLKLKSILAGGLIENEKSKNGEPTEENMYFAAEGYIRTGLSGMEAVKQIPILGEFANISERITGKQSVNIGYFKKNGCQPADHKKRYLCDYTLKLDVKTEGGMKEASAFMQSFFVMPGNTTGYFTHNGSKWVRSDTEAQIETDARNAREQSERFARESKELHDRGTEALHDYLRGPPSVRQ